MNFKQIEAFRAVMLSGSMTAAAEAMHTSQPNISRLIAQLERSAGFRLFERLHGRLQATDEGKALFRDVERAFVGLKSLEDSVTQIRQIGTGRLRIAAVPSISITMLPRVLHRFREAHPNVALSVYTSDSMTVAQWAASQFCDVGLAAYSGEGIPGIEATLVYDVPGVCIFPPGHPFAERESLTPKDFEGQEFISLLNTDGNRGRIDRLFDAHGVRRRMGVEAPYAATACQMVGLGMGVSLVSQMVAREYQHTGLLMRPFAPVLRYTSYVLRSTHLPENLLTRRFVDLLVDMQRETLSER